MTKTTIFQNQSGLLIRNGVITRELPAGTYKTYKFRNETIITYPLYRQTYAYAYSVRTTEAAAVTVDVTMGMMIKDAKKLYLSGKTAYEVVNNAVARILGATAGEKSISELLEGEIAIDEKELAREVAEYGLVARVELAPKVRLPRNLQNALDAQEVARQRAKAELEEARGRSAVIRHYANVAKITKENPDLLRLLLGQKAKSINVAFDANDKVAK